MKKESLALCGRFFYNGCRKTFPNEGNAKDGGRSVEIYTIRDVARKAGVAVSTVSRVLNGRPDVSEETRKKVMDVVEQFGFVQNRNARNLKNTKPKV